jgi:hypothetical protein
MLNVRLKPDLQKQPPLQAYRPSLINERTKMAALAKPQSAGGFKLKKPVVNW